MVSVIYEDNHLLCLDKPGALLTQPSGTERDSLEARGKAWLKSKYAKPGNVFLEAIHRIDSVACGLVLFARTGKALSRMSEAIRLGSCQKEYRALVERAPKALSGELRNWLVHGEHHASVVCMNARDAKEALLNYETLERLEGNATLLKVILGSGRYHQIRAQLAYAGIPILGDIRYGSKREYHPGCIALQHYRLTIRHPVSGEEMTFTSRIHL